MWTPVSFLDKFLSTCFLSGVHSVGSWNLTRKVIFQNSSFIQKCLWNPWTKQQGFGFWWSDYCFLSSSSCSYNQWQMSKLRGDIEILMIIRINFSLVTSFTQRTANRPLFFPATLTPIVITPRKVTFGGNISLLLNCVSTRLYPISIDEQWHPPVRQVICWQKMPQTL